jgi:hypothetical protein
MNVTGSNVSRDAIKSRDVSRIGVHKSRVVSNSKGNMNVAGSNVSRDAIKSRDVSSLGVISTAGP